MAAIADLVDLALSLLGILIETGGPEVASVPAVEQVGARSSRERWSSASAADDLVVVITQTGWASRRGPSSVGERRDEDG